MKKIAYLSLFITLFLMNACVQDEKDIFDESASDRMQNALEEYGALLASSETGWFVDYYPEASYKIGGYAMFLNFHSNGTVDVSCEIATNVPAREVHTSKWEMNSDQGPVLTFSTYNPVMHYFSEPSSADVDGLAGDYEYIVMKVGQDTIELKGKKRSNKLYLRRNTGNLNPDSYFKEVAVLEDKLSEFGMFGFVLKGTRIGMVGVVDRTFNIGHTDDEGQEVTTKVSYAFTPSGIRLARPFTFQGVTMQNFTWDNAKEQYTCTDPGVDSFFDVYFPADYELRFSELLGKWRMRFHGASATTWVEEIVEITETKKNATLNMYSPNLFSFGGIELTFNAQKGTITLMAQNAGRHGPTGYDVRVAVYDRPAGYLNVSIGTYGLNGIWNKDEGGARSITFVDNGRWPGYKPNGILLRLYDGSTNMGNFTANVADYRFTDITITKIND